MIDIDYYKTIAGYEGVTFEMKIALRDLITDVEREQDKSNLVEAPVMLNFAKELEEKIEKTNKAIEDTCNFDAHGDIKHAQLSGRLKCLEEVLTDIKSKISV